VDIATDDAGVWMTYEALADARDIQRDAARRLAQRHRWRRQTGNDGLARVLVPPEWASTRRDISRDIAGDDPRSASVQPDVVAPDVAGVVTALQGAIDTLRQQLVRADAYSDELRTERDQARNGAQEARLEADEAARRADAERLRAERAEQAAEQARQHVREAESAIAEMRQADEARKARGLWQRVRAAWQGNR
jgi:hypothetical protein